MKISILAQLEYPMALVSWLILIPFQYFSGFWMLKILTDRFEAISGWDFPDLAFLYSTGLLSHAFIVIFFIDVWHLDRFILNGDIDRILLRPLNPLFYLCFRRINLIGIIDLIPATVIFVWAIHHLRLEWTWTTTLITGIYIFSATLIRAGIYLALAAAAFWTKRSFPFVMGGMILMDRTTNFPQTIYPHFVQWLLTFLLPIGFIAFYPSTDILDKPAVFFPHSLTPLFALISGILLFSTSAFVFHLGLRSYESAGS